MRRDTFSSRVVSFRPFCTAPPNTFTSMPFLSSMFKSRRIVDSDAWKYSVSSWTVTLPFVFLNLFLFLFYMKKAIRANSSDRL